MRLKNLTPFLFAKVTVSREPPQPEFVAVVRAVYRLVPGGVVTPVVAPKPFPQGKITGDLYEEDGSTDGDLIYATDLASFKPRADLLLKGTVHAPAGQATKEVGVRFAVGSFSKILRVTGPRAWSDSGRSAALSAPLAFTSMPLSYREALGGIGDDANPIGKGREGLEGPRIERPNEPIHSRTDSFSPAGFGPLHPEWSERRTKLGRNVGREWRQTRAPHFPTDFDFAFFNAAPVDQQVPYLRGDEDILVQNAHAAEAVLKTKLASERVRVFIRDRAAVAREIPMHLDTLLVDTDHETVTVTWRGLTPCADPFGEDVEFALLTREELGAFDQREAYFEVLDRFSKDPLGLDEHLTPETRGFFEGPEKNPVKTGDPIEDLLKKRFGNAAPAEQAKVRELLQRASSMGAKEARTGEAIAAGALLSAKSSGPSFPSAGRPGVVPALKLSAPISAVEEESRRARLAMGPRKVDASELEKVERLRDDERLRRLDPSLARARVQRDKSRAPEPGEDVSDGDFTDVDFEGRDLSGVNFSGAVLERANLKRCKLVGATFEQAILFDAHLEDADLSGANLRQANLGRVKGDRAVFSTGSTPNGRSGSRSTNGGCGTRTPALGGRAAPRVMRATTPRRAPCATRSPPPWRWRGSIDSATCSRSATSRRSRTCSTRR